MPKRILVPLEGTSVSEAVLPIVAHATGGVGATLRLLHVAPVPHNLVSASGRVTAYADQVMGRVDAEWLSYLGRSRRPSTTLPPNASSDSATPRARSSPRRRHGARSLSR